MDPRTLTAETLLVYADSLESQGLAQGSLISLQAARQQSPLAPHAATLKRRELELIAAHRDELFGPLSAHEDLEAAWRLGFIHELSLVMRRASDLEALSEALALPSFARVERLSLTLPALRDLSFFASLPPSLRHLGLSVPAHEFDWAELLAEVSSPPSLALAAGPAIDFEGFALPRLRCLQLGVDFENLTREVAPNLRWLRAARAPEVLDLPGLELFFVEETLEVFEPPPGLRVVNEDLNQWAEAGGVPGVLYRCGAGAAGERAFVLCSAPEQAVHSVVRALEVTHGLTAAIAPVELGPERLVVVELREETANDGGLLRRTSTQLAREGHRVLEAAWSSSNGECIAWWVDATRTRPLVMGPFKERAQLWRRAIDQSFGFDPGDTLDEVLLALDAKPPVHLRGPIPEDDFEWPVTSTFPPPTGERDPYEEEEEDERAADAPFDPVDFRDFTPARDWWITKEPEPVDIDSPPVPQAVDAPVSVPVFEPEAAAAQVDEEDVSIEHEDEQSFDAASADWDEVMHEGPVDPEEDGAERNPEYGLEPDAFDPDSVDTNALVEDPAPEECAACGSRRPLRQCRSCRHHVCAGCSVSPGADDQVLCNECPPPRPTG